MNNKIIASITILLLILGLFQITLNFAPNVMSDPGLRKEVWKIVSINNPHPQNNATIDLNVTLNSRAGVYIACSPNVTDYFANEASWQLQGYTDYWSWLDGTSLLQYHWGEMDWFVSLGSLAAISYDSIQQWGDMYFDSGAGKSYVTFMGNTYMADCNLSAPSAADNFTKHDDPDIVYQAPWQGNQVKMIDDLVVKAGSTVWIVFKIVMIGTGSFTFDIASPPGVTVTPTTWTLGGVSTAVVPGDYLTIQAAIDASSPGDTIYVSSGTYNEALQINERLTVIGNGSATTLIDGTGKAGPVVTIDATADVSFSGFTIANASVDGGGNRFGMLAKQTTPTAGVTYKIANCTFIGTGNPLLSNDYGFYANGGREAIVFTHNTITQHAGNEILLEIHEGPTEISYNTLEAPAASDAADVIFAMTYDGINVTTLQNVSYNTFDMGTGTLDSAHAETGISFCSPGAAYGVGAVGKWTNIVVAGNTFNNLGSYRRGIGFWNNDNSLSNIISPVITNNTINGVASSTANYGIDFYGLTNNTMIFNNTITGTAVGVYLRNGDAPGTVLRYNNIAGNAVGVDWTLFGASSLDASYNWWGNETGPYPNWWGNGTGNGDDVVGNVSFQPWLVRPYPPIVPVAMVRVTPQSVQFETPSAGRSFQVNVEIANVTMMYGFQFMLRWNSTLLNLTSYMPRVPTAWGTNYYYQSIANTTEGNYSLLMSAKSPAPTFSGTVTVATLTFASIFDPGSGNVSCGLKFEDLKVGDINGNLLARAVSNGTYSCIAVKPKLLFKEVCNASKIPTQFDAYINVTNVGNLSSFSFTVVYDTSILTVINVTAPSFKGNPTVSMTWDPNTGQIFVNVNGINPPSNGSMILAKVTFLVINGSVWSTETPTFTSKLNFTSHVLNNGLIDHDAIDGTYIYKPIPGDLNSDGIVDIVDLMIVAAYFGTNPGTPYANADLNHDGWIDILDIILVARNWTV